MYVQKSEIDPFSKAIQPNSLKKITVDFRANAYYYRRDKMVIFYEY